MWKTHTYRTVPTLILYMTLSKIVFLLLWKGHAWQGERSSFVLRANNARVKKKKLHLKRRSYILVDGINLHPTCRLWPQDFLCLTLQAIIKIIIKTLILNSICHPKMMVSDNTITYRIYVGAHCCFPTRVWREYMRRLLGDLVPVSGS